MSLTANETLRGLGHAPEALKYYGTIIPVESVDRVQHDTLLYIDPRRVVRSVAVHEPYASAVRRFELYRENIEHCSFHADSTTSMAPS